MNFYRRILSLTTHLEPRARVSEAHCLSLYLLSRYVHLVLLWRLLVHANGDANLIHCLTPRPMVENAATLNSPFFIWVMLFKGGLAVKIRG